MFRTLARALVPVLLVVLFVGCSKKSPATAPVAPPPPTVEAPPPPPPPPPPPAPAAAPPALTEDEWFARKTVADLNAERPLGDVFFDYDRAVVRPADQSVLQLNAAWLTRWPTVRVVVEGHCDSRGTSEYNLALGDRRASAVKNYLVSLGVPADRVAVVTKGKESPFCQEETEACWQQNRRGHFVVTGK
jgi:peptidoglycan-associated lipoprotein